PEGVGGALTSSRRWAKSLDNDSQYHFTRTTRMTGNVTTQPPPPLGRALGRLLRLEWALVGAAALAATMAAALALVPFFAVAQMADALLGQEGLYAALWREQQKAK